MDRSEVFRTYLVNRPYFHITCTCLFACPVYAVSYTLATHRTRLRTQTWNGWLGWKVMLWVNGHSLPFLNPQGDGILCFGCHKLDRGAITRCVCARAPDPKSTISIPLGHPIPCQNAIRWFSDPRFDFTNVFNFIKLFYLFLLENTRLARFGLFNPFFGSRGTTQFVSWICWI